MAFTWENQFNGHGFLLLGIIVVLTSVGVCPSALFSFVAFKNMCYADRKDI